MPSLRRRAAGSRRRLPGDHGAVTALVAVLLSGGVLLGMGAIVVDVGQLYAERQELLSGADSAAMAVASVCSDAECPKPGSPTSLDALTALAGNRASGSARDGLASATITCGRVNGTALVSSCNDQPANLTRCAGKRPTSAQANYVEVATGTKTTGTPDTLLPPTFGRAVLGSDYQGTHVGACARVTWGTPANIEIFPLMISECAWNKATQTKGFAPLPGPGWAPEKADEVQLRASMPGCRDDPSSKNGDLAALFDIGNLKCQDVRPSGTEVEGSPILHWKTLAAGLVCGVTVFDWFDHFFESLWKGKTQPYIYYLPVYSSASKTFACSLPFIDWLFCEYNYTITGFAAFEMTGGFILPSWYTGTWCPGACFTGYFTKKKLARAVGGNKNFGVTAFDQIG